MNVDFPNISILGGGLLGGSLALALTGAQRSKIRLWARRHDTVSAAHKLGIPLATSDLREAVTDANLIILAVPVGAMPDLVSQAVAAGMRDCLVTDVGSVKRLPHETLPPILRGSGCTFIGSHPMAGSERNGLAAITRDLFHQAACLLTNDEQAPPSDTRALERFWQDVGCRTSWMTASVHDELVARISHLPHLTASAAARACLKNPTDGRFGGGGLRDTTRVAAGNPDMWAEIVTENREALATPLRELIGNLEEILGILERGDQQAAREWLESAKHLRDTLTQNC